MKMKRVYTLISLIFVIILSGCAKDNRIETAKIEDARKKIVIWSYYETEAQQDGLDWLVDGFNESQNEYEASWEYVPMTDFTKKLTMAYTEESLPDIALLDNPNMMSCIQMGMCEDITEFLDGLDVDQLYYPVTLETVTYAGKKYGLPAICNNLALIYNKKILDSENITPPQTWEELETAAKELTNDTTKGFLISAMEGEQGAFQLLPWILSTGEKTDNIGGDGTEKAFTYLDGLMKNGYMTSNCVNLSQTDVARAFINGETAMMANGPWVLTMLDESGIDYGIAEMPVDQRRCAIIGGEDFTIMKGKNVEGAEQFFKYYDQNEIMQEFCKRTTGIPAKMNVGGEELENMTIFRAQMEDAVVRSSIPQWRMLSDAIPEAFYEMVSGKESPRMAAQSLKVDNN